MTLPTENSTTLPETQPAPSEPARTSLSLREFFSTLTFTLTWETIAVGVLFVVALGMRLWELGARVMSHDEGLHVYYSWLLATGTRYAHNPMMHGPSLFEFTALVNFLFGANDFTSRLVPVVLGTFAAVFVPVLLRPWLGRYGMLATIVLMTISPYMLYYSRYIRHDMQVIAWTLLVVVGIFYYLHLRRDTALYVIAGGLAMMLATMEISFFYLAIFAVYLVMRVLVLYGVSWHEIRRSAELDLLVVLGTLGAFFSSPIAFLVLNPVWRRITGEPMLDVKIFDTQSFEWMANEHAVEIWAMFAVFSIAAIVIGLLWDLKRWPVLASIFTLITVPLFTTFFTNPAGFGTGLIGSLGYWLSQQEVSRGSQPWYYFFVVFPIYEYLPLIGGFAAAFYYSLRYKHITPFARSFVPFVLFWAVAMLAALSYSGEKMPWHSTHITTPFILLTGWWTGQLIRGAVEREPRRDELEEGSQPSRLPNLVGLALVGVLALATLRTSIMVNYINYDYTTEFIDYAHGAPGIKWAMSDLEKIGELTGEGQNVKVAYDQEVAWPLTWYLREYKQQAFYGLQPNRDALNGPMIIADSETWQRVEAIVGDRYARYQMVRMWWPVEDYKHLTRERIEYALTNPEMRKALWDIFWNRDYTYYAELTKQNLDPPAHWPLSDLMRVYIRKDIADALPQLAVAGTRLPDLESTANMYVTLEQLIPAAQILTPGLNTPRNLAFGPDGSLYVTDTGSHRIVRIDLTGQILASWGSQTPAGQIPPAPGTFNEPWGIAVDGDGNVYVADTWNHRIQKFSAEGMFLLEWGTGGVASEGSSLFWGPRSVAVDQESGNVYVTDTGNKRVAVFDSNGTFQFAFGTTGSGQLNEPVGVAIDPTGIVYIADTWNLRVVSFTLAGQYLSEWRVYGWNSDSLDNKPYLAVDSSGRVYVTDPEAYRVIGFEPGGQALVAFGQYGQEPESFALPVGIAVAPDGKVWVSDAGNNRLMAFTPLEAIDPDEAAPAE